MKETGGFFAGNTDEDNLNNTSAPSPKSEPQSEQGAKTPVPSMIQRLTPTKEWFEALRSPRVSDRSRERSNSKLALAHMTQTPFVLHIPEHLPNSPLCPKHPLYIGKCNRVCVYHGRKELFNAGRYVQVPIHTTKQIGKDTKSAD